MVPADAAPAAVLTVLTVGLHIALCNELLCLAGESTLAAS
jgi:hypothetical protein